MAWPLSQDYNEAIQSPATNFADADLKRSEAVANAMGLPMPCSGNFADVYQMRCPDGSRWAVKCFTREVPGLRERYQEISGWLKQAKLPFTVDFSYLDQGIRVAGQWYPALKMQWVEGLTLNQFVSQHLDKPAMLDALAQIWARMGKYLRAAEVGHCDLQHGNVLLVPGANANSLALKLIDYDGMWIPPLAKTQSGEVGHANYQHPRRFREGTYSLDVDRFPLLLVATSLHALKAGGETLWRKYDNADNLLFKEIDLREPVKSPLFYELTKTNDPVVRPMLDHLLKALRGGMEATPLLEQVTPEARPLLVPPPVRLSRLAPAVAPAMLKTVPAPVAAGALNFNEPAPRVNGAKGKRTTAKASGASRKVWIGAAAVVVGLAGGIAAWTMRGSANQPKPAPSVVLITPKDTGAVPSGDPDPEPPKDEDGGARPADPEPMKPTPATTDDPLQAKPENAKPGTVPAATDPVPSPVKKPVERLAVPDEATLADADKKIKVIYKEEYAKKKPEEMKALAAKLRADGLAAKDDPATQFVLLRESRDVSAKAGDMPSSLLAAESLSDRFVVDAAEMRSLALEEASRATLTSDARANVAALALAYAEDALDADDYATADRLTKTARTVAESITNRSLETMVLHRAGEVQDLRTAYASVQDAVKTLAAKPDDAAANLALAKFLCFDKGDWDRGLPMLALGSDPKLKELAEKDAATPTDAAIQDEVGNGYAALAKEENGARKLHLLQRAGYWYKQAEADLTGLPRTEVAKKIAEIDKTAPAAPPAVLFAAYGQSNAWTDHTTKLRVLLARTKDQKLALKADAEELIGRDPETYPPKTWVVVYRYAQQVRFTTAGAGETVSIPAPPDATPVTPAADQALTILYARYGSGFNWGDATAKAQELVKGATLTVKPGDLGFDDAATDQRKALVLVCRQGGRVRLSITGAPETAVLPDSANRFDAASRSVSADDLSGGNPTEITNSIRMKLRLIKPGTFLMGSSNEELGRFNIEGPQHEVEIGKAFYMGAYPVTKAQFAAFVQDDGYKTDAEKDGKGGANLNLATGRWEQKPTHTWRRPGFPDGDDHPVVQVSWNDATAFCAWLSKKEGKTYELPTEAEWEYACRAGTKTRFWCGDADVSLRGNANIADLALKKKDARAAAVPWDDGYAFTSPVGAFKPNPWGLYDMHGNVFQWCADGYGPYQEGYIKDPNGRYGVNTHVSRGCSWIRGVRNCRSANRGANAPTYAGGDVGFRVVMRIPAQTR